MGATGVRSVWTNADAACEEESVCGVAWSRSEAEEGRGPVVDLGNVRYLVALDRS
jgi:hypothetical protein